MDSVDLTTTAALVDVRGEHCPTPVIELSRAMETVEIGQIVEVLSDDPSSRVDIPVWCRMKHHEFLGVREVDTAQLYTVRRLG